MFLTFSVLVANPKKLLYTVGADPARSLLNRESNRHRFAITIVTVTVTRRRMAVTVSLDTVAQSGRKGKELVSKHEMQPGVWRMGLGLGLGLLGRVKSRVRVKARVRVKDRSNS